MALQITIIYTEEKWGMLFVIKVAAFSPTHRKGSVGTFQLGKIYPPHRKKYDITMILTFLLVSPKPMATLYFHAKTQKENYLRMSAKPANLSSRILEWWVLEVRVLPFRS